jgi:hypothetical protein
MQIASDLYTLPRLVRVTYKLQTGQRHSWQIWNRIPRQAARKASASRNAGLFHARVRVCQALPSLSVRCGLTPVARRVPTRRTQQGGLPDGLLFANLDSVPNLTGTRTFCEHDFYECVTFQVARRQVADNCACGARRGAVSR